MTSKLEMLFIKILQAVKQVLLWCLQASIVVVSAPGQKFRPRHQQSIVARVPGLPLGRECVVKLIQD